VRTMVTRTSERGERGNWTAPLGSPRRHTRWCGRLHGPLLAILVGCGSGEEEDKAVDDSVVVTMDELFGCRGLEHVLASEDEVTPLGFSPAELLADVSGQYSTTLEWLLPEGEPAWFGDAGTEVGLEIGIEYDGGEFRYLESLDCPGSCPLTCASRVDLDARASFRSDDGLFDEEWSIDLGAREVDTAFFLVFPFDPDATDGTLASSAFVVEDGFEILSYSIFSRFETGTPRGYLDADVVGHGTGAFVPLGVWGLP